MAKIGIQEVGGTQAAIQRGLKEVERMLPLVNEIRREECSVSELVLGVKCGGSDGFSGISLTLRSVELRICWCERVEPS